MTENQKEENTMKNSFRRLAALAAGMLMTQCAALADTISFNGVVDAGDTYEIYAPIGGTVGSVSVEPGQNVSAGEVLAEIKTTRVYAAESGTVTGIFGQPGDSAETVAEKYGAVMYIEGESVYTISASTDNAYDATENKFVHVGEEVYLSCYSDGSHTGTGIITGVQGTDYTVEVRSGEFLVGEKVNVYRGEGTSPSQRIGRGDLTRKNPTPVTTSGSIVAFAVENGDSVRRGDLLFETLDGDFDGLYMSGTQIVSDLDGTVAQVNLEQGARVEKDGVAAVIYPAGSMRIAAQVAEADLGSIAVGDAVSIELIWNQDEEIAYQGVISMISAIANETAGADNMDAAEVTYDVYIDFTPDEYTRYGMSAVINTLEPQTVGEAADDAQD